MKRDKNIEEGIPIWDERVVKYRHKLVDRMCEIMSKDKSKLNLADYSSHTKTTI